MTDEGLRRIDSIKEGELVLSKDAKTGDTEYKKVIYVYKKSTDKLILINTNGKLVRTTASHLFMVLGYGWKSAENLGVGDKIITVDGKREVINNVTIEEQAAPQRIYNLNVEGYHTFLFQN